MTKTFSYGSVTDKSVLNGYVLELTVTEKSTDPVENTSLVDFVLKLRSGSKNRFNLYGIGARVLFDGVVVGSRNRETAAQVSLGYNASVTLVSGSKTVPHQDDGTKSLTVDFSIDMKKSDYTPGPVSVTGKTMALTAIPRASSVAASDANIGAVSTVVVSRKNAAFTHTLQVQFGKITGYLGENGEVTDSLVKLQKTTLAFPIPESFYEEIPDKPTGSCSLICTTYSGESVIGAKETAFTVTAAKSQCLPEVTLTVEDSNPVTLALTGDKNTLVRGISSARCLVSASTKNGATVKSLTVAGYPVTEGVVEIAGVAQDTLEAVCTDSRGYMGKAVVTSPMISYIPLTCNASVKRLNPTGDTVRLTVTGKCFWGSFGAADNAVSVTCTAGEKTWELTPTEGEDSYSLQAELSGFDYTGSHVLLVTIKDALRTVTKHITVLPGIPVFDWGQEDFSFHVPVKFNDSTMTDFVVEQGDADNWYYRKWHNGLAECWYRKQFTADVTTPMGSLYTSGILAETDAAFPVSFVALPCLTASLSSVGFAGFLAPASSPSLTPERTGAYHILRPTEVTNATYRLCYHAVGRWK